MPECEKCGRMLGDLREKHNCRRKRFELRNINGKKVKVVIDKELLRFLNTNC